RRPSTTTSRPSWQSSAWIRARPRSQQDATAPGELALSRADWPTGKLVSWRESGVAHVFPGQSASHRSPGILSTKASSAIRIFMRSTVEVRVEHTHFGDAGDRQLVATGGAPDRFRRRTVVDAVRVLLVGRDIGVNPGHSGFEIVLDDGGAGARTGVD